jgi:hypothetical protein
MTDLSEAEFRKLLADKGLTLDAKAFAAALQGARHLRGEVAKVAAYLAKDRP